MGRKDNPVWIWVAVCRQSRHLLSAVVRDRTEQTADKFWKQVQARLGDNGSETRFYADHYEVYGIIVPAKQLVQSKKETYTVEGQNSLIRHFLARFHRRTFCYSKSLEMLTYSLALFVYRRNHKTIPI